MPIYSFCKCQYIRRSRVFKIRLKAIDLNDLASVHFVNSMDFSKAIDLNYLASVHFVNANIFICKCQYIRRSRVFKIRLKAIDLNDLASVHFVSANI